MRNINTTNLIYQSSKTQTCATFFFIRANVNFIIHIIPYFDIHLYINILYLLVEVALVYQHMGHTNKATSTTTINEQISNLQQKITSQF